MKLYECLKEIIEEKKIFLVPITENGKFVMNAELAIINGVTYIYSYTWSNFINMETMNLKLIYEDVEILDKSKDINIKYYEALGKVRK